MTTRSRAGGPATRALIEALDQISADSATPNIRRIADKLIDKALAGELSAIKEIFDRVDGKPASAAAAPESDEPQKVVFQWKTDP